MHLCTWASVVGLCMCASVAADFCDCFTWLLLWVQVEHGITEMVNRLDLVAWQLKLQCPGLQVG